MSSPPVLHENENEVHEKQLENRFLTLINLAGQNGPETMETDEQQWSQVSSVPAVYYHVHC